MVLTINGAKDPYIYISMCECCGKRGLVPDCQIVGGLDVHASNLKGIS